MDRIEVLHKTQRIIVEPIKSVITPRINNSRVHIVDAGPPGPSGIQGLPGPEGPAYDVDGPSLVLLYENAKV